MPSVTFHRLAGLEHQSPLGELVIRTCVGGAVLCAIVHLEEMKGDTQAGRKEEREMEGGRKRGEEKTRN